MFPDLGPGAFEKYGVPFFKDHALELGIIAALYCPTIFFLKAFMEKREPFKLKWTVAAWNFGLSVFSFVAAINVVPLLVLNIWQQGFMTSVCDASVYNSPAAWWIFVFNLSKVPEFVDTIWLRLKKRDVPLLHWFHHILTMLYCWYASCPQLLFTCTASPAFRYGNTTAYSESASGWYFASMNLMVHTIM